MRFWGVRMRKEVPSLSGYPWPKEFRKLLPFHAQLTRRWSPHVFLSRQSPHNQIKPGLEIKPAVLHPVSMSRTFMPKQGSCEQLPLPTCSPAEETLMCFLGTPWLLTYRSTAVSFVSSQDWFLLLKRLLKSCWLFLCYTASTAQMV